MASHAHITDERLKLLPKKPGVYLMKDKRGDVIYVGKARSLKDRVRTYFRGGDGRISIPWILQRVTEIETIITQDDEQAIILEADLIRKFKPRYNIQLKDDKAHLIVRIDMNHEWPRLDLVRKIEQDGARYIGPFAFAHQARELLEVVRNAVPLRTCSNRVIYNRVRPCLEHQIGRCAGPCTLPVSKAQYDEWVEQAVAILEGKNKEVVDALEAQMIKASEDLRFEEAALIRDRIDLLSKVSTDRPTMGFSPGTKDAFGFYQEGTKVELTILMVRRGRLFEARTFGFPDVEVPEDEFLGSVLTQFYSGAQEIPDEIVIPIELEDCETRRALYSKKRGSAMNIITPKKGDRVRLLALSRSNARENFKVRFGEDAGAGTAVRQLAAELHLEEVPRTIECMDISHFQGGSTVGSCVQFLDGKPEKARYRHFHMSQEGKPDDFASMREIVTRHLSRCAEENTLCDLLVIDGGPAQLSQALAVRKELSLTRPVMIGLAKKRTLSLPYFATRVRQPRKPERVFVEGEPRPIVLDEDSKALHLLEQIRNEAHRFAVSFHRSTRQRRQFTSVLERIPGVGETRRKQLLRAFGSVKAIKTAAPEEIVEKVPMPLSLAKRIVDLLNRGSAAAEPAPPDE